MYCTVLGLPKLLSLDVMQYRLPKGHPIIVSDRRSPKFCRIWHNIFPTGHNVVFSQLYSIRQGYSMLHSHAGLTDAAWRTKDCSKLVKTSTLKKQQ